MVELIKFQIQILKHINIFIIERSKINEKKSDSLCIKYR